jgi:hypothetical protein
MSEDNKNLISALGKIEARLGQIVEVLSIQLLWGIHDSYRRKLAQDHPNDPFKQARSANKWREDRAIHGGD